MLVIRFLVVLLALVGAATAQDVAVSGTENFDRKSSDDQSEKADYVRELEDVISARTRSIEYLDYMLSASRRRFGQMTPTEQSQAIEAFERIKLTGPENASQEDINRIRVIGVTEAEKMINDFISIHSTADELFAKLLQDSHERTKIRIPYANINARPRLTAVLESIKQGGVLSLSFDDVLYVTRDESGVILLSHVITALDIELRTIDEGETLSDFWHEIAFLYDALALDRDDLRRVLFWSPYLRSRYIDFARKLTVNDGESFNTSEIEIFEKDRPMLSSRILDYKDSKHTRTLQYARKFEKSAEPKPRGIVRPPVENLRVWTSKDGNFTTEAAFKRFEKGVVTLEKKDYSTIDVPLDNLSPADRAFVQKAVRDAKKK